MDNFELPEGFAAGLQQMASNYADLRQTLDNLSAYWHRWVAGHKKELDALALFLHRLSTVDLREVNRPLHEAELKLAESGWTIAGWMYRQDVLELSQMAPAELDAAITTRFMDNDAENLERLRIDLVKAPTLAQWRPLIEDIVASIKIGYYRVAIPSALLVLDGFISHCLVQRFFMKPAEISPIKKLRRIDWHSTDIPEAYLWESGISFLYKVFEPSDFSQDEPSLINRHWVLHGRSSKDWTTADALRLVNAVSTLEHLFETVGWPKDHPILSK